MGIILCVCVYPHLCTHTCKFKKSNPFCYVYTCTCMCVIPASQRARSCACTCCACVCSRHLRCVPTLEAASTAAAALLDGPWILGDGATWTCHSGSCGAHATDADMRDAIEAELEFVLDLEQRTNVRSVLAGMVGCNCAHVAMANQPCFDVA